VAAQGSELTASEVRLRGTSLSFVLNMPGGPQRYSGELTGNTLRGRVVSGNNQGASWQSVRLKAGKMDIGAGATAPAAVGN